MGTALSVCLLVYAGLSLFVINGPYVYMVVCVVYAYNLTPDQVPPLGTRYTPPGTRYTPWDQVPPGPGTPPGPGIPPGPGTPPGDTVYVRVVRILLECILVTNIFINLTLSSENDYFKYHLICVW